MALQTLSLLDQARAQSPNETVVSCIESVAARIIDQLDEHPPISLEVVASFRDIATVRVEPLAFAGSLTPEPSGLVMRLNSLDGPRRRRFSGFHEVGHTFQPGYWQQTLFRCSGQSAKRQLAVDPEHLSDVAAAELLLPERHFRLDIGMADNGCDGVLELADHYEASIFATALRFTRFAKRRTVLVMLEPGLRKNQVGQQNAQCKLRVTLSSRNGTFPFIPRNKSANQQSALIRALGGEDIEERASLADLGLEDDSPLHLSARLLPYRDARGHSRQRVMAIYSQERRASS